MGDCPLKNGAIERALGGAADDLELGQVKEHLTNPCPECEGALLGLPADRERLLIKFLYAPEAATPLTGEEKDDIFNPVSRFCSPEKKPAAPPHPRASGGRRWSRAFAIAAMAVLVAGVSLIARHFCYPGLYDGVKDGAIISEGGVFLQFLVLTDSNKPDKTPAVVRGDNNGKYASGSSLLFRFQLNSPAWLYLVRSGGRGDSEVIFPVGDYGPINQPGFYDATSGGELLVYPLAGLAGSHTFCAVAYPSSYKRHGGKAASDRALKEIEGHRVVPGGKRLRHDWIDCFRIEVGQQ
jgi:hypothetical protein